MSQFINILHRDLRGYSLLFYDQYSYHAYQLNTMIKFASQTVFHIMSEQLFHFV